MRTRGRAIQIIKEWEDLGILFKSDSINVDIVLKNEFTTFINFDVSKDINQENPYLLSLVLNDKTLNICILKRKIDLSGGGVVVVSYDLCLVHESQIVTYILSKIKVTSEVVLIQPHIFKDILYFIYKEATDKECIINIIKKYATLAGPTFESEGNELFADDAEHMAVRIFRGYHEQIVQPILDLNEDDIIFHDLYSNKNGLRHSDVPGHVRYVTESGKWLDVLNVNRKKGEEAFGVDLIYFLREYRSVVMVQYKKITNGVYYTSQDKNYYKEYSRMDSSRGLFLPPPEADNNLAHRLYRLNQNPFYFKLCPNFSPTKNYIVTGSCIPFDHWSLLTKCDHCKTLEGNFKVETKFLDGRYLHSSEFIALIQRGYIGGYLPGIPKLSELITEYKNDQHIVVAAIETPGKDYKD